MNQAYEPDGPCKITLGPLEYEVLQIVCESGPLSVRQVLAKMQRVVGYNTVMTTLARLYKKGLLDRSLSGRAFLYCSSEANAEIEIQMARALLSRFLACRQMTIEQKISMLHDAIEQMTKLTADSPASRQPERSGARATG